MLAEATAQRTARVAKPIAFPRLLTAALVPRAPGATAPRPCPRPRGGAGASSVPPCSAAVIAATARPCPRRGSRGSAGESRPRATVANLEADRSRRGHRPDADVPLPVLDRVRDEVVEGGSQGGRIRVEATPGDGRGDVHAGEAPAVLERLGDLTDRRSHRRPREHAAVDGGVKLLERAARLLQAGAGADEIRVLALDRERDGLQGPAQLVHRPVQPDGAAQGDDDACDLDRGNREHEQRHDHLSSGAQGDPSTRRYPTPQQLTTKRPPGSSLRRRRLACESSVRVRPSVW